MAKSFSADLLMGASGDLSEDAGITIRTNVEPLGGPGAPVKPAMYAGGLYQLDRRWDDVAEVDLGSASSRGRLGEESWMVQLRRGERCVIVAIGLPRHGADRLAEQITELLSVGAGQAGADQDDLPDVQQSESVAIECLIRQARRTLSLVSQDRLAGVGDHGLGGEVEVQALLPEAVPPARLAG